jgi:hypothetical protein
MVVVGVVQRQDLVVRMVSVVLEVEATAGVVRISHIILEDLVLPTQEVGLVVVQMGELEVQVDLV